MKPIRKILAASSCKHLVFERPDPELWIPDGYVLINVDSRGAGKVTRQTGPNSPAEFRDFYDAIEWAGAQDVSNGKVGLLGISYYAAGQWFVAAMKPKYLSAILPWQGTYDFYRDRTRSMASIQRLSEAMVDCERASQPYGNPNTIASTYTLANALRVRPA